MPERAVGPGIPARLRARKPAAPAPGGARRRRPRRDGRIRTRPTSWPRPGGGISLPSRRSSSATSGGSTATALRIVRRHEVADDVAQEAFLRAHQALDRFDLARPFGPWICRIAANLAINHVRSPAAREEPLPEGHAETPSRGPGPARAACWRRGARGAGARARRPARRAARRLRAARVRGAVLPGDRGGAGHLRWARSMSRLSRARERLREALAPYLGPAPCGARRRGRR